MNDGLDTLEPLQTQRTEYRDGGVLSAAALALDSAANDAAWNQHQSTAHIGGVVAGLFVTRKKNGDRKSGTQVQESVNAPDPSQNGDVYTVQVGPGAAIDSEGRMLLVRNVWTSKPFLVREKYFAVWLKYAAQKVSENASGLSRYDETLEPSVEELDQTAIPCPADDSKGILLAIIRKNQKGEFLIDDCCRRYVGAIGNRIDAPSKRASIALGPQSARDIRRFAIAVQSDLAQPQHDVLTWESTGTIRFRDPTSVLFPEEKEKVDQVEQSPILVVGSPTVNITPEDILDPCAAWEHLCVKDHDGKIIKDKSGFVILPGILDLVATCDQNELRLPPNCSVQLTLVLVRVLNQLIRSTADSALNDARDRANPNLVKVPVSTGDAALDSAGNRYVVRAVNSDGTYVLLDAAPPPKPTTKSLAEIQLLGRFPAFLTANTPSELLIRWLPHWYSLPGELICRLLLDNFLKDALRPLSIPQPRGLFFNGSRPADLEPAASRIHLVEFKKDGQTYRQLRITIPDPGKENSPQRYRCSIGTSDCIDTPAPVPEKNFWNQQTSYPRGILSVLADKSVDIHNQLNVFPGQDSLFPGLILKLQPTSDSSSQGAGGTSGTGTGSSGNATIPTTPILGNAVVWDAPRVARLTKNILQFSGNLINVTQLDVESLRVFVTVIGKDNTNPPPLTFEIVTNKRLPAVTNSQSTNPGVPIGLLASNAVDGIVNQDITSAFDSLPIIVNLLIMGVNRNIEVITTQYREELRVP